MCLHVSVHLTQRVLCRCDTKYTKLWCLFFNGWHISFFVMCELQVENIKKLFHFVYRTFQSIFFHLYFFFYLNWNLNLFCNLRLKTTCCCFATPCIYFHRFQTKNYVGLICHAPSQYHHYLDDCNEFSSNLIYIYLFAYEFYIIKLNVLYICCQENTVSFQRQKYR